LPSFAQKGQQKLSLVNCERRNRPPRQRMPWLGPIKVTSGMPPECRMRARSGRSTLLVREIELPAGLLDAHAELAYLPGTVVGPRPQLRHRQGGKHLELRAQLASDALVPVDRRVRRGNHRALGLAGPEAVAAN